MEAMKKMLKLVSSLSIAALFSLNLAGCAVDPQDDSMDDDTTTVDQSTDSPDSDPVPTFTHDREDESAQPKLAPAHCEQNYDCKSRICDQKRNACRDYPF